eukprot:7362164-Pyramimonas_sp.AAC.1
MPCRRRYVISRRCSPVVLRVTDVLLSYGCIALQRRCAVWLQPACAFYTVVSLCASNHVSTMVIGARAARPCMVHHGA